MGFASLQHMRNRRSFVRPTCRPVAGTSAGFDYPLDALLPSTPCRFYFTPAALMGFTLRSFLLAKGIWRFPAGRTHIPLAAAQECPKAFVYELATSVSGLCSFRESLAIKPVFSGSTTGCSLGFFSSRACGQKPCRDFARTPLTCLVGVNSAYATRTTESRSTPAWFGRAATASRSEQPNNPRRVRAPATSWAFERSQLAAADPRMTPIDHYARRRMREIFQLLYPPSAAGQSVA